MITELVRQYETLKRCNIPIPAPFFSELPISIEIILNNKGELLRVDWIEKPEVTKGQPSKAKKSKMVPIRDIDCPVTEGSLGRSSGNDSPHGIVDNCTWIFGELYKDNEEIDPKKLKDAKFDADNILTEFEKEGWISKEEDKKKNRNKLFKRKLMVRVDEIEESIENKFGHKAEDILSTLSPRIARRRAYFKQLNEFCEYVQNRDICLIRDVLKDRKRRQEIWEKVRRKLDENINNDEDWEANASKKNIRWSIETLGQCGKPIHSMQVVQDAWVEFQKGQAKWRMISCLDGIAKTARLLHPQPKRASLIAFNDPIFYPLHLHADYKENALGAQIGFEEAEKYALTLKWLIDNSSVRFGSTVNCIWIEQNSNESNALDKSGHELIKCQGEKTLFLRGKAKKKNEVLPDTTDLIRSLERWRNGQNVQSDDCKYRNKHFLMLSLMLRRKGRHAVIGGYTGTVGQLEDNSNAYVIRTKITLPIAFFSSEEKVREFCPTLMDIVDSVSIKSTKQKQLTWDREVVQVISLGQLLPTDLCRMVVMKAIREKYREVNEDGRQEYRRLLAIAAACARHYLNKEEYAMGLNVSINTPGYLAGRLFAVCEDIQKRGRGWKATLSDKLFEASISRPQQTLAQLYQNSRCYDMYQKDEEWFTDIFDKIELVKFPEEAVDSFSFVLGYWHQRSKIQQDKAVNKKQHQS